MSVEASVRAGTAAPPTESLTLAHVSSVEESAPVESVALFTFTVPLSTVRMRWSIPCRPALVTLACTPVKLVWSAGSVEAGFTVATSTSIPVA